MAGDLRRFILVLALLPIVCLAKAQDIKAVQRQMQGIWLSKGDSVCELEISSDSITTFRFKLNGVSACSYTLVKEPCEKLIKFPSATGIYIVEHYSKKEVCCALAEVSPKFLKIIYPNGVEYTYTNEKMIRSK